MIRYKPLPPSRSLDDTREIHRAVPLDPTATDDCCARLARSVPLSDRATAREWLGFFEALELVGSDADGYYRLDWPADERALGARFARSVLGAREVLDAVEAHAPVTADRLVEHLEESDEIHKRGRGERGGPDPDTRIRRLLGWSQQFGLVTESNGEYGTVDTGDWG